MSIRQRVPFRFTEEHSSEDEHVMDEQEQEQLIESLKQKSETQNVYYTSLMQVVLALSVILHLVYLYGSSGDPPVAVLVPNYTPPEKFEPIPLYQFFTLAHIFVHLNLSLHLLPAAHPIRRSFSRYEVTSYKLSLPLPFRHLFFVCGLTPLMAALMENGWADIIWWGETAILCVFIEQAQRWMREEAEGLRSLEGLKYDAKTA